MKRSSEPRSDATIDMADAIRDSDGDIEYPERFSSGGIQARREQVWKFLSRRVPQTVMAELLGVSRRTISTDVKWWKEQCQGYVKQLRENPKAADADIGMTAMRLEGMSQFAMHEAQLATGTLKNQFINTAIRAEETRSDLLIKTGGLPKAGEDIRVNHNIKATFAAQLGEDSPLATLDDPSSRRRVLSAAEQILRLTSKKRIRNKDDDPIIILDGPIDDGPITIEGQVKDS